MDKNIKKYQKIAPTIPYTYNKYNHKEILKEIGKLTNNEDKAKKWIEEWDDKTRKDKKEIKVKLVKQQHLCLNQMKSKYTYITLHGVVVWILFMMHSVCQ